MVIQNAVTSYICALAYCHILNIRLYWGHNLFHKSHRMNSISGCALYPWFLKALWKFQGVLLYFRPQSHPISKSYPTDMLMQALICQLSKASNNRLILLSYHTLYWQIFHRDLLFLGYQFRQGFPIKNTSPSNVVPPQILEM